MQLPFSTKEQWQYYPQIIQILNSWQGFPKDTHKECDKLTNCIIIIKVSEIMKNLSNLCKFIMLAVPRKISLLIFYFSPKKCTQTKLMYLGTRHNLLYNAFQYFFIIFVLLFDAICYALFRVGQNFLSKAITISFSFSIWSFQWSTFQPWETFIEYRVFVII